LPRLRLALARLRQLPALVLDFIEQTHVLDRNHRLVGEGLDQLDLLAGERPTTYRPTTMTPIETPSRRKLPKFEVDGDRYQYAWPPRQPTLAETFVPPVSWFIPVDPQAEADERERRAREDNDRMKEFYQKQQREREEREAAEAIKERDRQAYRERGWPSG
jgi:hypothetical protein